MNARPRVVAIDGAAGSGKSTLARLLARRLHVPYVNTGIMYRALAHAALRGGLDLDDGDALAAELRTLEFHLAGQDPPELKVAGLDDPSALTSPDVEASVSQVARHPQVRTLMRERQRAFGEAAGGGAVFEGRDMAGVVFPDAPVKLFVTADPEIREARRIADRGGNEGAARALHVRDARDAETYPLEPAPGAVVLDTTDETPEQTLERALGAVRELAPELIPAEDR